MIDTGRRTRRNFLACAAGTGPVLLLGACSGEKEQTAVKKQEGEKGGAKEVLATEDLMREHGVLRRALLVFGEAAVRLRRDPSSVPPEALQATAKLFRSFGEDYHERKLEEVFIFPALKGRSGPAAGYPDILVAQHNRGREITDYILTNTRGAKIGAEAGALAAAMEGFTRMYEYHAACEDTIVFPAWKDTVTDSQYDELSDKFEEIEHQEFGADGFEDAVKKIGEIESSFGLADIAQFTAPPPPSAK